MAPIVVLIAKGSLGYGDTSGNRYARAGLGGVRASRDSLLEDFDVTAATVTTFNSGENSLGFEIAPAGEKILIKVNVELVQQGVYALPTVSVFDFDGDTLHIPNSDIRQPIDFFFLFEGARGSDLPFF